MWFNPSDFKKTAEDPSAIFAISAIPETQNSKTAEIATPSLVIPEIENSKIAEIANRSESNNAVLSIIDSSPSGKILSAPDEDDRHHCHECKHLRSGYCFKQQFRPVDVIPRRCEDFTGYPNEIARIVDDRASEVVPKTKPAVTCKTCMNFESYHAHGSGAGLCKVRVMPYGVCHWSETVHQCAEHEPTVDPLEVTVWTPSGTAMTIRADDADHADWLLQMNPKPENPTPKPESMPKHDTDPISEAEYNAQGLFYQFLITRQDGSRFYSYSIPRQTLEEAHLQYPEAAAVEPVPWGGLSK
jgi:hypothetical protein